VRADPFDKLTAGKVRPYSTIAKPATMRLTGPFAFHQRRNEIALFLLA